MAISIIYAAYGTTNATVDVSAICRTVVSTGNDDITFNNVTMGGDPDFGVVKSFVVVYTNHTSVNPGTYITQAGVEGATIDLAP